MRTENIRPAAVFSDNMVLQREQCVRIFGECSESCTNITVSIPELENSAEAVISDGKWEAILAPMQACGCVSMDIVSGDEKIHFGNVAIGEVWLAGGQSNMEYELRNDSDGHSELKKCSAENVRYYYTNKKPVFNEELLADEELTHWDTASEKNSLAWSAAGYYFAKELSRKLGVTVGIIGCNWGGTSASCWLEREYLEQDKSIACYIENYDKAIEGKTDEQMIREYDEYLEYHAKWKDNLERIYLERQNIRWEDIIKEIGENKYPGPMGISNPVRPCGLHKTMVSRVAPYTIKGVIWYQGESDDNHADSYCSLMSAVIKCWRKDWKNDNLPFVMVQLPMFMYANSEDSKQWAYIREAQMQVYNTVKNTGLAVALDCGEFNNIHPINKKPVGHRLYLQAMSEVYGIMPKTETFPPVFREYCRFGDKTRLIFDNCEGFSLRGELIGFEADYGSGFESVEAEISGNDILLETRGRKVLAVRFQWTNYAQVTLFGKNGIPVPPFRTDN